jgi:plastocyanin
VYTLTARGSRDQKQVKDSVTVRVNKAAPPPAPTIKLFTVTPHKIHIGDTVTFTWNATNQKSFILDPGNKQLSQFEESAQDAPTQDTEYKLRAFNAKGDVAIKTVQVKVVPVNVCIAEIDGIGIKSTPYVGSPVKLRWSTRYARGVRIDSTDTNISIGDVSPGEGGQEVTFTNTNPVTFTITATDSANKTVSKSVTITPKVKPLPPPPPVDTNTPTIPPGTTPPGGGAAPDSQSGQ